MLISLGAIIIYVAFRFQRVTFGFAAVAALVHDVLVVLGVVALASPGQAAEHLARYSGCTTSRSICP